MGAYESILLRTTSHAKEAQQRLEQDYEKLLGEYYTVLQNHKETFRWLVAESEKKIEKKFEKKMREMERIQEEKQLLYADIAQQSMTESGELAIVQLLQEVRHETDAVKQRVAEVQNLAAGSGGSPATERAIAKSLVDSIVSPKLEEHARSEQNLVAELERQLADREKFIGELQAEKAFATKVNHDLEKDVEAGESSLRALEERMREEAAG